MGNVEGALYVHLGALLLGSRVSYMFCSVPASSWEVSFASFRSYLG